VVKPGLVRPTTAGVLGLAAVALGVFADEGQRLPGAWSAVPALGTPWLLLGLAGGRLWPGRRVVAALAGSGLLVVALWTYYVYVHVQHGTALYNAVNGSRGLTLTVLAAVVGAVSGLAGASTGATKPRTRALAWGFVVAVPTAELWRAGQYGDARQVLRILLTGTALSLLLWGLRHGVGRWRLAASALTWTCVGLAAIVALHDLPL
jgi:Family of unknown function (DUF6518)